ncbi:hypothetical protein PhCBS80983_g00479 [Powellomyces hirtus]|uniref:Lysosomal dipeptide transporter MFSD1 n=1 Tax=Powellomyces hirtus TaxID=109895 RepID=A0A507EF18_9FUNG|nr:hypothetical protein PhCBS80983_g00479 [Powellomyces hirtus]
MLSTLYALYSLPNTVLPFVGGYLGDVVGARTMVVALATVALAGQILFSVGVQAKTTLLMNVGRVLFGVGAECLGVVQTQITSAHFRTAELALALGLNLSVARLGSVLNDLVTPVVGHRYSAPAAVWLASCTCGASLLCALALAAIHRDDRHSSRSQTQQLARHDRAARASWKSCACTDAISAIRAYPSAFWLLGAILCALYATVIPFNTIHAGFLKSKFYPTRPEIAAQLTSIPDTLSALLVPLAGHLTDHYGRRVQAIALCAALIAASHIFLALTPSAASPIPALVILGIAYCLLLTFWPCVAIVVGDDAHSGLAFGITTSLMNISLTLFPPIVAQLVIGDNTYTSAELFFASCAVVAFLIAIGPLTRSHHGRLLNAPPPPQPSSSSIPLRPTARTGIFADDQIRAYELLEGDDQDDDDGGGDEEEEDGKANGSTHKIQSAVRR